MYNCNDSGSSSNVSNMAITITTSTTLTFTRSKINIRLITEKREKILFFFFTIHSCDHKPNTQLCVLRLVLHAWRQTLTVYCTPYAIHQTDSKTTFYMQIFKHFSYSNKNNSFFLFLRCAVVLFVGCIAFMISTSSCRVS